ncbi:hypothetical protein F442_22947 [Phytophthora nicotianae P10297]|uniref:Uncharacterized protein n=2 Tax=Phytophthora nicotianae TaxID=4792 RepID=W2XZG4_PHYNI|nr:hypothetical protein L914_21527 [Phytophthora nicotianae]ETP27773.1 hypothetical protein F442_22947 [Phytophthora nicotianae P10297]
MTTTPLQTLTLDEKLQVSLKIRHDLICTITGRWNYPLVQE